jgi:hypothetical protein
MFLRPEWVIAYITAFYAIIAWITLSQIKRQAGIMERQTGILENSVSVAKQSAEAAERGIALRRL